MYTTRGTSKRRVERTQRNKAHLSNALEIETLEQWRRIGVGDIDICVPWDTLVKVFGSACRTIVFGQVENARDGDRASDAEGETTGDGDGERSGGDIDSTRVDALLAGDRPSLGL